MLLFFRRDDHFLGQDAPQYSKNTKIAIGIVIIIYGIIRFARLLKKDPYDV